VQPEIKSLIARGALFVVNHSGGKDSQAMQSQIAAVVPDSQILVLHAHLPGVEWAGTLDHIKATTTGYPLVVTEASKSFMDMVRHRQMFPSPQYRQCTSDLKRGPLEKAIRHYLKAHPEFNGLVVNCMGLRAEESPNRAKARVFRFNSRNSKAGREWYDWLPIQDWTTQEVFTQIWAAGQKPHWAYEQGMSRLSCCFCIMSSKADLVTAARLNPELYAEYVHLEREVNHTMLMPRKGEAPRYLDEIIGIPVETTPVNNPERKAA